MSLCAREGSRAVVLLYAVSQILSIEIPGLAMLPSLLVLSVLAELLTEDTFIDRFPMI